MFDILNSRDFYNKLVEDYQAFDRDKMSASAAINCALSAYHLAEWVWGDWLKKDTRAKRRLGITTLDDFKTWLDEHCYSYGTLQGLANGSKHFDRKAIAKSEVAEVMWAPDGNQPTRHTYLSVEVERDGEVVWQEFSVVADITLMFWAEFMGTYSPYEDIFMPEQLR